LTGAAPGLDLLPGTRGLGRRLRRFAELAAQPSILAMHDNLLSVNRLRLGPHGHSTVRLPLRSGSLPSPISQMQLRDTLEYLPDDILTKVDRASMSVGLEVRVPLLDHRLAERAFALPASAHVQDGKGKFLLRQMLEKHVPKPLFDRPKKGFGVPVGNWLQGPLRDWAESLLTENCLQDTGFFCPGAVRRIWHDHVSRRGDWGSELWMVLMLQHWSQHWRISL
jgi:asparagine synthase (glutamine-hydrolysing)